MVESYESLLEKAYKKVKVIERGKERFEVPAVTGQVAGKKTVITNLGAIASYVRRQSDHIAKFLQRELATSGKIEGERLVLNTKLSSTKVNEKILLYTKEFVLCNECKKPDTEIIVEKGIKFKHCLACGAKSPVRSAL